MKKKYQIGDILVHKTLGCVGIVIEDPKYPGKIVVQIHPNIFGDLKEEDWDRLEI